MVVKGLLGHVAEGRGDHGGGGGYMDYGYICDGYIGGGYVDYGDTGNNDGRGILGGRGIRMMRGRGDGLQ